MTTNRDHIIQLADDAGFDIDYKDEYHGLDEIVDSGNRWITSRLEYFYLAAQREAYERAAQAAIEACCSDLTDDEVIRAIRKLKEES